MTLIDGRHVCYVKKFHQGRSKNVGRPIRCFSSDSFVAYKQFLARHLNSNEYVIIACEFVAGLPENMRHLLRASTRIEVQEIIQLFVRACQGHTEGCCANAWLIVGAGIQTRLSPVILRERERDVVYHECGDADHFTIIFLSRRSGHSGSRCVDIPIRCYRIRPYITVMTGKQNGGTAISADLIPRLDIIAINGHHAEKNKNN